MANLSELPVDCVANVISLTSPKDACRLSLVASDLQSVADSDQVWEKFLPADYQEILSRSKEGIELLMLLSSMSKKQFFRLLCIPLLIDGKTRSFWIDKSTGKKCFLLGVRVLTSSITAPGRLAFVTLQRSRFSSALRLCGANYRISFTYVIKSMMLSPDTRYGAYLVFDNVAGDELVDKTVKVLLSKRGSEQWYSSARSFTRKCQRREDGWLEVELGELLITGEQDADLMIRLEEEKYCYSKESDLIYEGIEIRVKH